MRLKLGISINQFRNLKNLGVKSLSRETVIEDHTNNNGYDTTYDTTINIINVYIN